MIDEFTKYVKTFDFDDENIKRKYYHSLRVKNLCQLIGKYAGFNDKDLAIAEVVGLLHDYARFKQWTDYHTYVDRISIDHGDLGIELLFDNKEITNYWDNEEDYDEIYDAIKYHNKYSIPDDLSDHNKLLCKVIRDADKLDILYLFVSGSLSFKEDGDISKEVKEDFDNKRLIDRSHEITDADYVITTLAFVHDFNFKYSYEYLKEYKIIEKLYDNIVDKDKFKYYFDKLYDYIDYKIKNN